MKNLTLIMVFILCFISVRAQKIIVYPAHEEASHKYHELTNYYLPKTELKIKIPIVTTSYDSGLFHKIEDEISRTQLTKMVKKKFGWDMVNTEKKSVDLGEKIQFVPTTVQDSSKYYTIAYKKRKTLAQTMNLTFNEQGIISSGEFAQKDQTFQYVTKGIELAATVAGKFFPLGVTETESFRADTSIEFQRAKVLLKELDYLVTARVAIINQKSASVSKDALSWHLEQIDKRTKLVKEELLGKEKKSTKWYSFLYVPDKNVKGQKTVLLVITDNGVETAPTEEDKFRTWQKNPPKGKKLEVVSTLLSSQKTEEATSFRTRTPGSSKIQQNNFLRYNMPAQYSLQLLKDGKPLKTFKDSEDKKGLDLYKVYFPQNGDVGILPNKYKEMSVIFYEDIGAIKELKFKKDAIGTSSLDQSYAAIDSLFSLKEQIKAFKEAKKDTSEEESSEEEQETVIRIIFGEKEEDENSDGDVNGDEQD